MQTFFQQRKNHLRNPLPANLGREARADSTARLLQAARVSMKPALPTRRDAYEQEAARIADRVSAAPAHQTAHNEPLNVQPVSGRSNGGLDTHAGVEQTIATPGSPLEPALRVDMEQRFGHDFSRVRVHSDAAAEQSARDMNAAAYTVGPDIVFGAGRFAPSTDDGRRLIAHELAHVAQQSAAEGSSRVIQRDELTPKTSDDGQTLTVVIRAPDDQYTQNITAYVRNTLNDKNIIEVDNIQEIFPYLEKIKASKGPKLKKIRLIAHGSTIGGIKMKLPGQDKRQFVNPAELEKMAEDKSLRTIASGAMDQGATVEFYGCYVGREPTTEIAISTMFQSEFRSPDQALHTEDWTFEWNGKTVSSTAEIDEAAKKNKKAKSQFEDWLLQHYQQLAAAGTVPDAGTKEAKIAAMRDLFDRSKGRIKQLIIETEGGGKVRPTEGQNWASQWRKWNVN